MNSETRSERHERVITQFLQKEDGCLFLKLYPSEAKKLSKQYKNLNFTKCAGHYHIEKTEKI